MTDGLDELHAQAALTLLRANANLAAVFDSVVDDGTDPAAGYVLVYTTLAFPTEHDANDLRHMSTTAVVTWTIHHAALTAAGARALADQTRETLLNVRPAITGRSCGFIKQDENLSPTKDETTGRPVMDAIATYSCITRPNP